MAQKEYKRQHATMLQRKFIEIFVKRMGYDTVKSGMSMLRKEQERMKRSKYCGT